MKQRAVTLMLDSGAFSVQKTGEILDLPKYCKFIQDNADWIDCYVNMDHIDMKNTEESSRRSWDNYIKMRERGLHPIPVFHVGEDITWLRRMLDEGAQHISISAKHLSPQSILRWYDTVFHEICNRHGDPVVRIHGLGETTPTALLRYPWYSVDSSSWLLFLQRYAICCIPGSNFKFSAGRNHQHSNNVNDLDRLRPEDKIALEAILRKHGISVDVLKARGQDTHLTMCILSAIHYLELGERASERCPIRFTGETGFFHGGRRFTDDPGLVHKRTLVYLAAGGNIQWSLPTLAAAKCDTVLVSYYDILKNKRWECLRDYVYDPKGTVERDPIFERHLAQIKQHVEW